MVINLINSRGHSLLALYFSNDSLWLGLSKHLIWLDVDVFDVMKALNLFGIWALSQLVFHRATGDHHNSRLGARPRHRTWSVILGVPFLSEIVWVGMPSSCILVRLHFIRTTASRTGLGPVQNGMLRMWSIARPFQHLFFRMHTISTKFFLAETGSWPWCRSDLASSTLQPDVTHL